MKTFYDPDSISFWLFLRNHHWSNLRPSIPMSARRYGRKMKRFSCCTFPSYIKTFLHLAAILIAKCFLFSPGRRFVWFSQSVMFKVFGSQRETDKIVYWGIWFFTSIIWAFFFPRQFFHDQATVLTSHLPFSFISKLFQLFQLANRHCWKTTINPVCLKWRFFGWSVSRYQNDDFDEISP